MMAMLFFMRFKILFSLKILQHNAGYIRHYFPKCLSFQYEHGKRLPVQSQQLEQSLKYLHS